jgi:hypothetical protein
MVTGITTKHVTRVKSITISSGNIVNMIFKCNKNSFNCFVKLHKQIVTTYPTRQLKDQCKYYLVIVEPRMHDNFEFVCKTMLRFTNKDWGLHVFHGNTNALYVKRMLQDISNVKFTNLNVTNLTIKEYNNLLTSVWFYEQLLSQKVLLFQTDSCLLKEGIERFLEFDYIGAPWPHRHNQIGNGGFSLRDKNVCINICKSFPYQGNIPEDVYFSNHMKTVKAKLPDFNTACSFSCELISTTEIPLGVHQFVDNIKCPSLNETFQKCFMLDSKK